MEKKQREHRGGLFGSLFCLGGCFLLGGLLGCLSGCLSAGTGAKELEQYLHDYILLLRDDSIAWSAASVLWNQGRWVLGCILLGLSGIGLVGVPALFGLRGFVLAFSISCFLRFLGWSGLVPAIFLFGLPAVVWAPGYFLLGAQGLVRSLQLFRRQLGDLTAVPTGTRGYRSCILINALLILVCAVLECSLLPVLLRAVAGMFV